jgi:hypothetical protein
MLVFYGSLFALFASLVIFLWAVRSSSFRAQAPFSYILFTYTTLYFVVSPIILYHGARSQFFPTQIHDWEQPLVALNIVNIFAIGFATIGAITAPQMRKVAQKPIHLPYLLYGAIPLFAASCAAYSHLYGATWAPLTRTFDRIYLEDTATGIGLFILIESAPSMFTLAAIGYLRGIRVAPSQLTALFVIGLAIIIAITFTGNRGSRSSMMVQILLCGYLVYFFYYRLSLLALGVIGTLALAVFVGASLLKYDGIEASLRYADSGELSPVSSYYLRLDSIIVGDLTRVDVQAVVLARYQAGHYQPTFKGETYLHAASLLLPGALRPDVASKAELGSYALYGAAVNDALAFSSRIYGLLGESILNFGLWAVPLVFYLFGRLCVLAARRSRIEGASLEGFTAPALIILPMLLLFYDSGNLVVFFVKNVLPVYCVALIARWMSIRRGRYVRPARVHPW